MCTYFYGITVQNCHWGGKLSVLWSDILLDNDALVEP